MHTIRSSSDPLLSWNLVDLKYVLDLHENFELLVSRPDRVNRLCELMILFSVQKCVDVGIWLIIGCNIGY